MPTKKPTKKPAAARAARAKRTTNKSQRVKSFRIVKERTPFMSTRPTRETLYWIVICAVVVVFTLWILKLQSDVQSIYDSIDANSDSVLMTPQNTKHHKQ